MDRGILLSAVLHGALAAAVVAVVQLRPKPIPVSDRPIPIEIVTKADITRLVRETAPRRDRPAAKPGRADRPPARPRAKPVDTAAGDIETDAETAPVSTPPAEPVVSAEPPPPSESKPAKSKPKDAIAQVAPPPDPKPLVRPAARQAAASSKPDEFGLVLQTVAAIKHRQGQLAAATPAPANRLSAPVSRTPPPIGPARQIPSRQGATAATNPTRSAAPAYARPRTVTNRNSGSGRKVQTARRGQAGSAADYYAEVEAWLRRHQHYPLAAKRARQEGKVVIQFTMSREGRVLSHTVLKSSGHRLLDRAAEQTVMIASPLPPAPAVIPQRKLTLMFSINYEAD